VSHYFLDLVFRFAIDNEWALATLLPDPKALTILEDPKKTVMVQFLI
jgi:hypothetical protein